MYGWYQIHYIPYTKGFPMSGAPSPNARILSNYNMVRVHSSLLIYHYLITILYCTIRLLSTTPKLFIPSALLYPLPLSCFERSFVISHCIDTETEIYISVSVANRKGVDCSHLSIQLLSHIYGTFQLPRSQHPCFHALEGFNIFLISS